MEMILLTQDYCDNSSNIIEIIETETDLNLAFCKNKYDDRDESIDVLVYNDDYPSFMDSQQYKQLDLPSLILLGEHCGIIRMVEGDLSDVDFDDFTAKSTTIARDGWLNNEN